MQRSGSEKRMRLIIKLIKVIFYPLVYAYYIIVTDDKVTNPRYWELIKQSLTKYWE